MEREKFGSRLGFILVSAGCAVGLGNVWKFPYMCGQYGGAAFIAIYLVFLVILGYPIIVCEFAVGRGSQKSCATSFRKLEPKGRRWHYNGYIGMAGCYLLMMYYTMVTGWMLYYFFRYLTGSLTSQSMTTEQVSSYFSNMLASPGTMILFMIIAVVLSFAICSLGLKNGVERITKVMMICLLGLILVLAVHSCLLPGSGTGIRFYLVPDFTAMQAKGIGNVIFAAMSQAFFTLSIGIGAMAIFGSYLDKERSLSGEALSITLLDTFVALMAGLIIIPACFSFRVFSALMSFPDFSRSDRARTSWIWKISLFPAIFCHSALCAMSCSVQQSMAGAGIILYTKQMQETDFHSLQRCVTT